MLVDDPCSLEALQGGGDQRYPYAARHEADGSLHEPRLLYHFGLETGLPAVLDDLVAQARPLISRGEDERLVGERTQRHPWLVGQRVRVGQGRDKSLPRNRPGIQSAYFEWKVQEAYIDSPVGQTPEQPVGVHLPQQ